MILKRFVYNEKFECIRGNRFFVDGEIRFPHANEYHREHRHYRTRFGPCFNHSGTIYAHNNENVRLALRRMTAKRFPGQPGLDEKYECAQEDFITKHKALLMRLKQEHFSEHFTGWKGWREECIEHVDDPHPKRELRIHALEELVDDGKFTERLWLRTVLYKMKKDEIAKVGKRPRMIGDLGVAASLQGFVYSKKMKLGMSERVIDFLGGTIEFCPKPSPDKLVSVFAKLKDPPGKFYFVYFSDDSCYAVRTPTGVRRFNVDISGCDASHTTALFEALRTVTPDCARECIDILIEQLQLPMRIVDINDKLNVLMLLPKGPKLYSGSTLTTLINNLANILIAISLFERNATTPEQVSLAASLVGYKVTVIDASENFHTTQFLKHSPVYDTNGNLRALLNLGVLMRMSGTCRGDLPGKGPIQTRGTEFQSALLRGAYPRVDFTLIRIMKTKSNTETRRKIMRMVNNLFTYKTSETEETFTIPDEEVYKRYDLSELEIASLHTAVDEMSFGYHYASNAVEKILKTDYELGCRYF